MWRFAISNGVINHNPIANIDNSAFIKPPKTHFNAILDKSKLGEAMDAFNGYAHSPIVRFALLICPMVFVRPGEMCAMKWSDVDLINRRWSFLVTKTKTLHIVPLSSQVVTLLKQLKKLTAHSEYFFANRIDIKRMLSNNTLNSARKKLGCSPDDFHFHGSRATARTMLVEELDYSEAVIEHQLAHRVKDANGRAYNRTTKLKQRFEMMQEWSDFLEKQMTSDLF